MKYRFLHFALDTERFELLRKGKMVVIQPQAFAILTMLVEKRDKLMLKEELVRQLWSGRTISDSALSSQIKMLRRILGDDGQEQHIIQTVYGRGFRFAARVEILSSPASADGVRVRPEVSDALVDQAGKPPVIAVLPLCKIGNMGAMADCPKPCPQISPRRCPSCAGCSSLPAHPVSVSMPIFPTLRKCARNLVSTMC
ncbi:hypothetical protein C8024_12385 [Sphingopyxis sp. BSNA05]|uniref:winged helix-turn-helix domain-containing protein n=1 Tax=Sphingopyxis sp. BSNA05 TaxID=1236614 RepID=UPI001E01A2A9|nr:transcriptional regulator [Sphingopyxis sp. BSNA05]NRD90088.1 hypothetical protein [Sphingopyxis sp. BSNA05]